MNQEKDILRGGQDRGFVPNPQPPFGRSPAHPSSDRVPKLERMDEINRRAVVWYFPKARVRYAEYRAFLNVLQILGTTCSRFFRKVIRETIQEGPDPLRNDLKLFRDALYQVAALGRNLNQLMRAFNAGLAPTKGIDAATLADLGDSVYRLRQELAAVILRSKHRWVNHD